MKKTFLLLTLTAVISCTGPQQDAALRIAERRGYITPQDAQDARDLATVFIPPPADQTSTK